MSECWVNATEGHERIPLSLRVKHDTLYRAWINQALQRDLFGRRTLYRIHIIPKR